MEKFDPTNPKYKKIEDLPREQQGKFIDIPEGGFVKKEANEYLSKHIPVYSKKENPYGRSLENEAYEFKSYAENRDFFINEAPKLIEKNDYNNGVIPVAKKLGMELRIGEKKYEVYELKGLFNKISKITYSFDEKAEKLLDAVANLIVQIKGGDYKNWSHAICGAIEDQLLIDNPGALKILTKLVNDNVRRQKEEKIKGCSDRMINPIIKFNMEMADMNIKQDYIYKPESLRDNEYVNIMKPFGGNEAIFLETNSPFEYCKHIIEKGENFPDYLKPELQIKLLQASAKYLPRNLINKYVKKMYNPNSKSITYDELIKNYQESQNSLEVIKGVYVDVEGTLIKNHELNNGLVERLKRIAAQGHKIIIFTGGDLAMAEKELIRLGLPEYFLPIQSKDKYRGKIIEMLIDDTPPEYQGFKALKRTDFITVDEIGIY